MALVHHVATGIDGEAIRIYRAVQTCVCTAHLSSARATLTAQPGQPTGPEDGAAAARRVIPKLHDTQTHAHLRASFAHDAQASRLSERFARVAEIEGFPEIARAFRELAESQAFHAQGHLDLLLRAGDPLSGRRIGDTLENVRASVAEHEGELSSELIEMIRTARSEGFPDIASWFETMQHIRVAHQARLSALLADHAS